MQCGTTALPAPLELPPPPPPPLLPLLCSPPQQQQLLPAACCLTLLTPASIVQPHKAGRKAGLSAREKHRNTKGAQTGPACMLSRRALPCCAIPKLRAAPVPGAGDAQLIFTVCLSAVMQTINNLRP